MSDASPPFGQADLTNCERELIHLAGSIQPHGLLLVVHEAEMVLLQASAGAAQALGLALPDGLVGRPLAVLGGALAQAVQALAAQPDLAEPQSLALHSGEGAGRRQWHGLLHRVAEQGVLVLELERHEATLPPPGAVADAVLPQRLADAVQRFSQAASLGALADSVVRCVRELTGYDRVMVYKFDPDGHGKIIAEARDPRLDSLLGLHYPASDLPQRARSLYLRNRVRVLVDVHYQPLPIEPRLLPAGPAAGQELDMSMCTLRSMSPLHLQYLKNMGVTGTLVVSLVREGKLWGLIAAHHDSPRALSPALRAACDLLAEVATTRIGAIENYAYAQVAILVRRLEQRLVEATSTEGDWRLALFRNPRTLLQPLEATGAALFHDGEVLTSGEVPSTPELRALLPWVHAHYRDSPFACSALATANPALDSLTPVASGVLAVKLSTSRPDYLMWFRKEQLLTVTWAGDPAKPVVADNPLELSPRRSFAAWSEIVRGTALPWSGAEQALARAIGAALVDIIVQVNAVRLLVAEHQLVGIRAAVNHAQEPVAVLDAEGRLLFANPAFAQLLGQAVLPADGADLAARFTDPAALPRAVAAASSAQRAWRGELALRRPAGEPLPVALRVEQVPGRDGRRLGLILVLSDLSDSKRAAAARQHLEQSLQQAAGGAPAAASGLPDEVMAGILTNASLAAMDIADNAGASGVAPLLQELETATQRAAGLYGHIRRLAQR